MPSSTSPPSPGRASRRSASASPGCSATSKAWIDQVKAAAERADEPVWQLPLAKEYRKLLDSNVADMKNVGGPVRGHDHGRAVPPGVRGRRSRGPTSTSPAPMNVDADEGWLSRGATGFGTRLLVELVAGFKAPAAK